MGELTPKSGIKSSGKARSGCEGRLGKTSKSGIKSSGRARSGCEDRLGKTSRQSYTELVVLKIEDY